MKNSVLAMVLLGLLSAFLAIILSLFLTVDSYQIEDTSNWPTAAQEILRENFPQGAVTEDQWQRLHELNKELRFMGTLGKVIWRDILKGWWWFLVFPLLIFWFFGQKHAINITSVLALTFPSVLLLICAIILGK
jgi:hypothetical protein